MTRREKKKKKKKKNWMNQMIDFSGKKKPKLNEL